MKMQIFGSWNKAKPEREDIRGLILAAVWLTTVGSA